MKEYFLEIQEVRDSQTIINTHLRQKEGGWPKFFVI